MEHVEAVVPKEPLVVVQEIMLDAIQMVEVVMLEMFGLDKVAVVDHEL